MAQLSDERNLYGVAQWPNFPDSGLLCETIDAQDTRKLPYRRSQVSGLKRHATSRRGVGRYVLYGRF